MAWKQQDYLMVGGVAVAALLVWWWWRRSQGKKLWAAHPHNQACCSSFISCLLKEHQDYRRLPTQASCDTKYGRATINITWSPR